MNYPAEITTPKFLRIAKFIFRPIDYLEEYGQRYGDLFMVGGNRFRLIYVNHPQGVQDIFKADSTYLEAASQGGFLGELLGDNSILFQQGEKHQRQRRLLTPPFHGERVRSYGELITGITNQVSEHWQPGTYFNLRPVMQEITLRVILEAVFGLAAGERYQRLKRLLGKILESFASPGSSLFIVFSSLQKDWGKWSPWGRFLRLKAEIDQLIYREIAVRRSTDDLKGEDILTLLLLAEDEEGEKLTDQEVRDELMTLLVAGHETTASALSWALYWIHYQPGIETKLRSELAQANGLDEMMKLPYLKAICLETLRIYPIALTTFPRVVKQSWNLMGYQLEPGTFLSPCVYLVHHREELYPNPKEFKPERFLERQYANHEYFPFGGGSRRCIGSALAMLEMQLVVATLMEKFEFKLKHHRLVKPVRRGLTAAPPGNLGMVVTGLNYDSCS